MKRAHRRAHLIMWVFLIPVVGFLAMLALSHKPVDPSSAIPDALMSEGP